MKKLIYFIFLFLAFMGCKKQNSGNAGIGYDLPEIKQSGDLVVLTLNSSTSYFNYRGQEMGFQYELAQQFARSQGLKLEIKVARSVEEMLEMLAERQADLIVYNVPVTKELKDSVLFCGNEVITHQVLVQRNRGTNELVTDVTQLIGKEVHVKPGRYYDRLVNLNNELGGGIVITPENNDSVSIEDLITSVSTGRIPYTVCDNDVAALNKTYYPNLNINLQVSHDQRSSWVTRKDCPQLAAVVDAWSRDNQASQAYEASAKRYFEISKAVPYTSILSLQEGKISHYDDLFKKYSKEINWDWRLLAALAYTESNFDSSVVSWAGAVGLMQLMPSTAQAMGVPEGMEQDPEQSIKAATKYIASTSNNLRMIQDQDERINFVLGAYNAGLGHIYDAMALADKYGSDKNVWADNVEKYILLKSNEEYFNDPVCKHGYFRGIETYNFVRDINSRFETYKAKIKK